MAYVISEDCIACGTCIDECPVGAISEGDIYSIDPETLLNVVLVQMFAPLKQFIRENNTILRKKKGSVSLKPGLFILTPRKLYRNPLANDCVSICSGLPIKKFMQVLTRLP